MLRTTLLVAPAAALASLSSAQNTPEQLQVIFTDVASSPLSAVPGLPGVRFETFDRPNLSPDGSHYVLAGQSDLPNDQSDFLITDGMLLLKEGDTLSVLPPGVGITLFDQSANINNAGEIAMSLDTDAPTTEDDYVVLYDGAGNYTVIAAEGSPIPGAPAGWVYDTLNTSVITDTGVVAFESDSIDGTAGGATDDNAIFFGSTPFIQKGVDSPTGQLGATTETWDNFDFEDLFVDATGANYILQGDLNGDLATDDVAVVNGVVVAQEGFPLPGGDPAEIVDGSGIASVFMSASGDWIVEGDFDNTNVPWVLYNGAVVTRGLTPLFPGSTSSWAVASLFASTCNNVGDFLVGGISDNPDPDLANVVVLNNERVILREGDPVDVDGNGVFDDDAFFNFFSSDDFRLTDDLQVYFIASIRDSSGTVIGDVFCVLDAGEPFANYCMSNPNSTGVTAELSAVGSASVAANDITLVVSDVPPFAFGFYITGMTQGFEGNPAGSAGNLCLAGNIGRYVGPGQVQQADASGSFSLTIDLTNTPQPNGFVAIAAGEVWNFQAWLRDSGPAGPTSNFTNGLEISFN